MAKWVYNFGGGRADGSARRADLLGGKGANLAEMCRLQLPVPPGFTISTSVCQWYLENQKSYPDGLADNVEKGLKTIGRLTGRIFGDARNPLLLSVRSGARVSMPGMMDTVLNLGLNDKTVEALARQSDERFAYDSYRRFIQMYGDVVMGIDHSLFEEMLDDYKDENGFKVDTELSADDWKAIIILYKQVIEEELGEVFPQDPHEQLWGAIGAVFSSWMNSRAIAYRALHDIPECWGTAVNVQAMVFGNMGDTSATGVAFTRNPSTGENALYGEYLVNAQGEDVVAGIRTPYQLTEAQRQLSGLDDPSLEAVMPEVFKEFVVIADRLEQHYRDMQDIEFTIERGKLWMLQTRSGKRTAQAALRIAVEMAQSGLITPQQAVMAVDARSLDQLLHPMIDKNASRILLGGGLPASPGAACGELVFSSQDAVKRVKEGGKVILCRMETSPEDIHGMHVAQGILTARGGMTSHAAVVARSMGKPCVCGVTTMRVDQIKQQMMIGDEIFQKGDFITIDGVSGEIFKGEVAMVQPELSHAFARLMEWADRERRMDVRTNAETPLDAEMARSFGAEGIGLCRTEHMFFEGERIHVMREMILAEDEKGRRAALDKLLPMQRDDFIRIFEIMKGLPVTIRLLDPPLHEFLPRRQEDILELAQALGLDKKMLVRRIETLHEFNPMLGMRGCRLAIVYPEIAETQARAIFEAAIAIKKKHNIDVKPEIMVPLVSMKSELDFVKERIETVATLLMQEEGIRIDYQIGTMIELPRAALNADRLAETADFFSFGTNDLTQTTFGISRDDSSSFLEIYLRKGLMEREPFGATDALGVGQFITMSVKGGRKTKADLKIGVCGEQGGDPDSILFFEKAGLDYISCSAYRVPVARLAAAQAAMMTGRKPAKRLSDQ